MKVIAREGQAMRRIFDKEDEGGDSKTGGSEDRKSDRRYSLTSLSSQSLSVPNNGISIIL